MELTTIPTPRVFTLAANALKSVATTLHCRKPDTPPAAPTGEVVELAPRQLNEGQQAMVQHLVGTSAGEADMAAIRSFVEAATIELEKTGQSPTRENLEKLITTGHMSSHVRRILSGAVVSIIGFGTISLTIALVWQVYQSIKENNPTWSNDHARGLAIGMGMAGALVGFGLTGNIAFAFANSMVKKYDLGSFANDFKPPAYTGFSLKNLFKVGDLGWRAFELWHGVGGLVENFSVPMTVWGYALQRAIQSFGAGATMHACNSFLAGYMDKSTNRLLTTTPEQIGHLVRQTQRYHGGHAIRAVAIEAAKWGFDTGTGYIGSALYPKDWRAWTETFSQTNRRVTIPGFAASLLPAGIGFGAANAVANLAALQREHGLDATTLDWVAFGLHTASNFTTLAETFILIKGPVNHALNRSLQGPAMQQPVAQLPLPQVASAPADVEKQA